MVKLPFWATVGGVPTAPGIDEEKSTQLIANAVRANGTSDVATVLLDGADASRWLWELVDRWEFKGAGQSVMQRLFAWLASDEDIMRLGELLMTTQRWGPRSPIPPRLRGIEVLSNVDSDCARVELLELQRTTPRDDLWVAVRDFIHRDSDERGIEPWQWHDLACPDFGFEGGRRRLPSTHPEIDAVCDPDLGYREVKSGVSHPRLPDVASARLLMPEEQRANWLLVEARVVRVLHNAQHRLERAMVLGHGWPTAMWRRLWHGHGLLGPMARSVVWIAEDEHAVSFLPTAEDDFLGEAMETVRLREGMTVRPAHPCELDVDRWTDLLATHEVIQAIDQLVRLQNIGSPDVLEQQWLRGERLVAAEAWGWQRRASKLGNKRDIVELATADCTVSLYLNDGLSVSKRGRADGFQPTQRVKKIVVRRGDDEIRREEWPALVRAELAVLARRAAP